MLMHVLKKSAQENKGKINKINININIKVTLNYLECRYQCHFSILIPRFLQL